MFPKPDSQSLVDFFGQPWKVTSTGLVLDPTFEANHIIRIDAPYDMWMGNAKINKIAVNKKCAKSLFTCLDKIARTITAAERKQFGLDQYGGCFNFRPIRGSEGRVIVSKLSLHSYGAAIDLAPQLNPLNAFYRPEKLMMPHQVIDIFKAEGWKWGGDFKTRPDCMHFEATA